MKYSAQILRCFVSSLTIFLMSAFIPLLAQVKPTIPIRQNIVDKLNAALDANQGNSTTPEISISITPPSGDQWIDEATGGCAVTNPLDLKLQFFPDHFVLKRKVMDGGTLSDITLEQPLINDLNAWLNAVWGMDLRGIKAFDDLGWQCGSSPNRYYTDETTNLDAIKAVQDLSGEQAMLESYYLINGVWVQGSTMFSFTAPGGPRTVRYMTDRGDGGPKRRYLGNAYLKITLPTSEVFEFSFVLQTSRYGLAPDTDVPCGISEDIPTQDAIITTHAPSDVLNPSASICQFSWLWQLSDPGYPWRDEFPKDPDEASAKLFEYIEQHRGDWLLNQEGEDGSTRVEELGRFRIDLDGKLQFVRYYSGCCDYRKHTIGQIISPTYGDEWCEMPYCRPDYSGPSREGGFELDPEFKQLIYTPPSTCSECAAQPVFCIRFCDSLLPVMSTVQNVIKTDARIFSDRTPLVDERESEYTNGTAVRKWWASRNDFERGARGKWRPSKEFLYRTSIIGGSNAFTNPLPNERNYNSAGTFTFSMFNWKFPVAPVLDPLKWINTNSMARYAQNGEAVEDRNIFNIPTAARFAHWQQLPILMAKNSPYDLVDFESFEDGLYGVILLPGWNAAQIKGARQFHAELQLYPAVTISIDPTMGHAGRQSVLFEDAADTMWSREMGRIRWYDNTDPLQQPLIAPYAGDLLIRFWARKRIDEAPQTTPDPDVSPVDVRLVSRKRINGTMTDVMHTIKSTDLDINGEPRIKYIAETGEWSLYELTIPEAEMPVSFRNNTLGLEMSKVVDPTLPRIRVDDVRIQPVKSEMTGYVYDPENFRQVAQFDDQHFALFFQYNGEGQLVRKLRETERGIRTTQETQYHMPLVERSYASLTVTYGAHPGGLGVGSLGSDIPSSMPTGTGTTFDLLDIELGLDSQSVKIFGVDPTDLIEKFEQMKESIDIPSLDSLSLPALDQIRLGRELAQADAQLRELEGKDTTLITDENQRAAHERALQEAERRRAALMTRLGLTEKEAVELIDAMKNLEEEVRSEEVADPSSTEQPNK